MSNPANSKGVKNTVKLIAGVDEAGRGPLAGPVVVSAVVLDPAKRILGLRDSKQISAAKRQKLAQKIKEKALAWSIIYVNAATVDQLNILQATMTGMTQAVGQLGMEPQEVMVDGNRLPNLNLPAQAVIGGDSKIKAISAASILAKTARDSYMEKLDPRFPEYGFARHKGYPTPDHLKTLQKIGPTPEHRRSFAPVQQVSQGELWAPVRV